MIKFYNISFRKTSSLLAILMACSFSLFASGYFIPPDSVVKSKQERFQLKQADTAKNKLYRPNKNPLIKINFAPFKPAVLKPNAVSTTPNTTKDTPKQVPDTKLISNLKVYPNPVEDQINFSYHLNKESTVTIKVMDMLGNELMTLLSQKISVGDQVNSFNVGPKLNTGFYFIRFVAGNETTVKRISVL